jgi:ribokinase
MKHHLEMLAIGDVVTDAFIELLPKEAEIEYDSKRHPLLCMSYGTKIPFQEEITVNGVGNAPNAAVAWARLGFEAALMSNIGADQVGQDILHALSRNHVSTEFIHVHPGKVSNYHYVLWYKSDRTILIKHEAYHYQWPDIRDYQRPEWVYLSSIGEAGFGMHARLEQYLAKNDDIKLVFQPGTFQIRAGHNKLSRLYKQTEIFAANKEEFQQILGKNSDDEQVLIHGLHQLGPKIVLLTDGPKGAFASDGQQIWFMAPYPDPKPPLDRTGAGDCYASTFAAAVAMGKDIPTALAWAGVNSMQVVQYIGAQKGLLSHNAILGWLKKAPSSYRAKLLRK